MATGYVLQGQRNRIVAAGNTNLFTVPAGHIYKITGLNGSLENGSAAAGSIYFQVSDNTGANFQRVTPTVSSTANNNETQFFAFAGNSNNSVNGTGPTASNNSAFLAPLLLGMNLVAGQILRAVDTTTQSVKVVQTSWVDYTI